MTQQAKLWEGIFGDAYQERNTLDKKEIERREAFFTRIFMYIYSICGVMPKSVLEIGAGQGPNLCAIEKFSLAQSVPIKLYATEINQKARIALSENAKTVEILDEIPKEPLADLVLTYGVMIHTHPAHLRDLVNKMYNSSNKFLMCCEYFAPQTRPIPYRGEKDALWLDDYGSKMLEFYPSLEIKGYGFMWKPMSGLDNITYWVMQKRNP